MSKERLEKISFIADVLEKLGKQHAKRIIADQRFFQEDYIKLLQKTLLIDIQPHPDKILRIFDSGLKILACWENEYPESLKNSPDPPLLLYIHGQLPKPSPMISIVGSRKADISAWRFASKLARDLADAEVVIVSGLAKGIDCAAHSGALESGKASSTIAVLAHGLHMIYPRAHEKLAQAIVMNGGSLISEYPPGALPLKHQFLERNRIVAALGKATVVIQAGERGGALVTAREALDAGKDLYVTPGPVDNLNYLGSHKLLKTGAYVATCAEDLLELFPDLKKKEPKELDVRNHTPQERALLTYLKREKTAFLSNLPEATKLTQQEIMLALSSLELSGTIEILPGDRLILSGV